MKLRLEHITWADAGGQGKWHDIEYARKAKPSVCDTVGWVLHEDAHVLTLVGSIAQYDAQRPDVGDRTTLPKVYIRRRRRLGIFDL